MLTASPEILYEDNHIVIVNKKVSDLVQKDITQDVTLAEEIQDYLKTKYNKAGNVYIGIPHRLDRPVSGAVMYAKTSKALSRLSQMFKNKEVTKKYWAVVEKDALRNESEMLTHYLVRNTKINKSIAKKTPVKDAKESHLYYQAIAQSGRYTLLEVDLLTGRHHQIRCQLSAIGCPIRGDKKYGFKKANPDGGINLHARYLAFVHPVKKEKIEVTAPLPDEKAWNLFDSITSVD